MSPCVKAVDKITAFAEMMSRNSRASQGMDAMSVKIRRTSRLIAALASVILPSVTIAAPPSPADALKLVPVQKDVEFDVPEPKEIEKCVVNVETIGGFTGYVVKSQGGGQVLRRFLDTNGDNKV